MIIVLTAVLVGCFTMLGLAKVVGAPGMLVRAAHVGFNSDAYKRIGALELLAVLGLLLGLIEAWIGLAAAVGLVLLMAGACVTHLRKGDGPREIAPAVVMTAALVSYLVLIAGAIA
ncbi:DoxX family protein [Arthrobacter sp. MI7-26]|uniref:DoxX family protein n=1 Tax=Arthrobacter sp. MI7-26 TaxID=2993653 RepID=UPI002249353D|nr:DoxX family protein [Arthrobacter sp. MI7-26]MCX2747528.1 DoxX family protein [Arthrobacter sp. MI7-26]